MAPRSEAAVSARAGRYALRSASKASAPPLAALARGGGGGGVADKRHGGKRPAATSSGGVAKRRGGKRPAATSSEARLAALEKLVASQTAALQTQAAELAVLRQKVARLEARSPKTLLDLPHEGLCRMLAVLVNNGCYASVIRAGATCKALRAASRSPEAWPHLQLDEDFFSGDLPDIRRSSPPVFDLSTHDVVRTDGQPADIQLMRWLAHHGGSKGLRTFRFTRHEFFRQGMATTYCTELARFLRACCSNLSRVEFTGRRYVGCEIFEALSKLPRLRVLRTPVLQSESALTRICSSLASLQSLERLELRSFVDTVKPIESLIPRLPSLHQLSLHLDGPGSGNKLGMHLESSSIEILDMYGKAWGLTSASLPSLKHKDIHLMIFDAENNFALDKSTCIALGLPQEKGGIGTRWGMPEALLCDR